MEVLDLVEYNPVLNCFVLKDIMKKQSCNCHPDSPFHWKQNPRPSIFLQDPVFRAKGVMPTTDYKLFGIYSRAQPFIKPSLNKHEI